MDNDYASVRFLESRLADFASKAAGSGGGRFVIPFASTRGPLISCNAAGAPVNVGPLVFGFCEADYTVPLSNGLIDLTGSTNDDRQFSFSVPVDCIVENIYMNAGPWAAFTVDDGQEVFPFVELYWVPPANNMFMALPDTKTEPESGFTGAVAASAMLSASKLNIGAKLAAGSRVMIVGHIEAAGTGTLTESLYMYFTGGISFVSGTPISPTVLPEANYATCAQNNLASVITLPTTAALPIPLQNIAYSNGFAWSADGTSCTVGTNGLYLVRWMVNAATTEGMVFVLSVNGTFVPTSLKYPNDTSDGDTSCDTILNLTVGDVIQLQVGGKVGAVTLRAGVGAELTIVPVSGTSVIPAQKSAPRVITCAENLSGSTLTVTLLDSTAIPLPSQSYNNGFTWAADGTACTVTNAGTYLIRYRVSGTVSVGMQFGVALNGAMQSWSIRTALLTVGDISCETVVECNAGDTIQLQVKGVLGTVILAGGVGACMIIEQIA